MNKRKKSRKVLLFVIFSVLALLLVNFTFISAYVILFGEVTLNPGENYIINIPFIGPSKSPTICGRAQQSDGTNVKNVNISVKYDGTNIVAGSGITGNDGKYCIYLPNINKSNVKFDISVEHNESLILGDNDYSLNFDNYKVYNKNLKNYAILSGNINNYDAEVEDGRFEVKVGHRVNGTWKYVFGDYQKYLINIEPYGNYEFPNNELNVSWRIPNGAENGEYKFLIKTSFNAREYASQSVFFNITG